MSTIDQLKARREELNRELMSLHMKIMTSEQDAAPESVFFINNKKVICKGPVFGDHVRMELSPQTAGYSLFFENTGQSERLRNLIAAVCAYIDKAELDEVMNRNAVQGLKDDLTHIITKESVPPATPPKMNAGETASAGTGEATARFFHDTYERLAPHFGYETRKDTKQFDPTTPNGRLMIAVCNEVANKLAPAAAPTDGTTTPRKCPVCNNDGFWVDVHPNQHTGDAEQVQVQCEFCDMKAQLAESRRVCTQEFIAKNEAIDENAQLAARLVEVEETAHQLAFQKQLFADKIIELRSSLATSEAALVQAKREALELAGQLRVSRGFTAQALAAALSAQVEELKRDGERLRAVSELWNPKLRGVPDAIGDAIQCGDHVRMCDGLDQLRAADAARAHAKQSGENTDNASQ